MRELVFWTNKRYGLSHNRKNGLDSYLTLNLESEEEIIAYQVEMLRNNPHATLLTMQVLQTDGNIKLSYRTTGKTTLTEHLRAKPLNKTEYIRFVEKCCQVVVESKKYLLYPGNFILDSDYIFLDANYNISFVYVPLHIEDNSLEKNLNYFLHNLLSEDFMEESYRGDLAYQINHILENNKTKPWEIIKQVTKLKDQDSKDIPGEKPFRLESSTEQIQGKKVPTKWKYIFYCFALQLVFIGVILRIANSFNFAGKLIIVYGSVILFVLLTDLKLIRILSTDKQEK